MTDVLTEELDIVKGVKALRPAHGGTCFSLVDGRPLFISGAIPGEVVDVQVRSRRSKVSYGTVAAVVEASEHRRPHVWPEGEAAGIGGVDLGHVSLDYQRVWKKDVIRDQLARVGGAQTLEHVLDAVGEEGLTVHPASDGAALNWRTRVDFEVSPRRRLAMNVEASSKLVEVESMPLAVESILDLGLFGESEWSKFFRPGRKVRVVAPNAGGRRVVVGNQVFNASGRKVSDSAQWQVSARGLREDFSVAASGFWQAHKSAPADLVERVLAAANVNEGDSVIELYSGAGLFTKFLGRELGRRGAIISIEGSKEAVANARENLRDVEVERDLRAGMVNGRSVLRAWSDLGERPNAIVLDPPRSGAGRDVVKAIGAVRPDRVVLVSCDAAAGARDIGALLEAGYRVRSFRALDLFPQTHHVEFVTMLTRTA
ncbi:MAG: class I SAM-dependent RNA methyltransferase [Actinomycetaceae bacterium]|nr:class I SAM-dependent RNA methyltransferase [Actinomycetaceae bacterium]